jgi:murein DD-endopeptidase MepM/ murein hydrolase activator NlpD
MFKEKEISDILSLYKSILKTRTINESPSSSEKLFGGETVKIPNNGPESHKIEGKPNADWQSTNAWDISARIGTPVYAISSGIVKTLKDYGNEVNNQQTGKTLFGVGFTVKSDGGLPEVYYTHLKDVTIKVNDKVSCGQLLGYVTDFPNNSSDHVHIGVQIGNIDQFLNNDGTLKCSKGQLPANTTTDTTTGTTTDTKDNDSMVTDFVKSVAKTIFPESVDKERKLNSIDENIKRIKKLL